MNHTNDLTIEEISSVFDGLRRDGVEIVAAGPVVLALHFSVPLPKGHRPTVVLNRALKDMTIAHDLSQFDVTIADDPISQATAIAEKYFIEPWRLISTAEGCVALKSTTIADIDAGRLRMKTEPRKWLRGRVDRILKMALWSSQTGLQPTRDFIRAAKRDAGHILSLDRNVWREHFNSMLVAFKSSVGLQLLFDCGVLQMMLHEVCAMHRFHESCAVHHKDIWDHTLQVVDKCPPSLAVRWTALMHDTGKVWTRTVNNKGKVHFFRHEELGASLMRGAAARFALSQDLTDRICYVIGNHARANVYSTQWTDSAVRRLIRDMGPHLDDVIAFSRSDYTTKRAWRIKEVNELGQELVKRIDQVRELDARVPPLPKGLGNALMTATGHGPGRWLGDIQQWLEAEVEAGRLLGGLQAVEYVQYVQRTNPQLLEAA